MEDERRQRRGTLIEFPKLGPKRENDRVQFLNSKQRLGDKLRAKYFVIYSLRYWP